MGLFDSIKDRQCESNKKVSYAQRSPIETKKANTSGEFRFIGQSFSFGKGEVVESALYEKVVRDCAGDVLRKTPVRRFRKIGSDEWFSVPATIGNNNISANFSDAGDKEAIKQAKINQKIAGAEEVDTSVILYHNKGNSNQQAIIGVALLITAGVVLNRYF